MAELYDDTDYENLVNKLCKTGVSGPVYDDTPMTDAPQTSGSKSTHKRDLSASSFSSSSSISSASEHDSINNAYRSFSEIMRELVINQKITDAKLQVFMERTELKLEHMHSQIQKIQSDMMETKQQLTRNLLQYRAVCMHKTP
jgi:hypothetical protein